MKSIFHSEKTVTVDGVEYRLEADVTHGGTQTFKVTNTETEESETCTRKGKKAYIKAGMRTTPFPNEMKQALEAATEVEDVIVK